MDFTVNNSLSISNYIAVVDMLVDGYFDVTGEYQPHYGLINAMRVYFNVCVETSPYEHDGDITKILDLEDIIKDEHFQSLFNDAICIHYDEELTFGNAYYKALDIVDTRKSSIGQVGTIIKNMMTQLVDYVTTYINDENMDKFTTIAQGLSNGNISAESIIEAYANSERFQNVIQGEVSGKTNSVKKNTRKKSSTSKKNTSENLKIVE